MYDDVPIFIKEFLQYMISIKNRSKSTINEYYYDLRDAFKFLKLYKAINVKTKNINDELITNTQITDLNIDFVKQIELNDLYEYLTFLSERAFWQGNNQI